jgi:hypothetical protein
MVRDGASAPPHHEGLSIDVRDLIPRSGQQAASRGIGNDGNDGNDDIADTPSQSRGANTPELLEERCPLEREGAGNAGCPPHP